MGCCKYAISDFTRKRGEVMQSHSTSVVFVVCNLFLIFFATLKPDVYLLEWKHAVNIIVQGTPAHPLQTIKFG